MNENKRTFYQTRSAHSAFETRAEENGKNISADILQCLIRSTRYGRERWKQ